MMRRWLPIVMIVMAGAAMPGAQASLEYNVKAALLLNFARYIDWPEAAFADASTPVSVCVFGGNPFGDVLERTLQGESIDTRSLEVRQVRSPAASDGCHLLFVPAGAEARARTAMHRQGAHAVTVGESRRFEDLGGAVTFVLENGRVRFKVNLRPVEQRGVRISARMLQLASEVERATPGK